MQLPHGPNPYLPIFTAAGVKQDSGPNGWLLVAGTTYYVPIGGEAAPYLSGQVSWDAAAILTAITLERTNDPAALPYSTANDWVQYNAAGADVTSTASGVVTAGTVAVAGGTAGTAIFNPPNTGVARARIKIVVGGTGGRGNAFNNGKS